MVDLLRQSGPVLVNSARTERMAWLMTQPKPKAIVLCKRRIKNLMKVAEFRQQVTRMTDKELVEKIVQLKLHLDDLYLDWIEGRLSEELQLDLE